MVGLLGYALAGGLQGAGKGLVEDALAKREAMLRQLEMDRDDARFETQRADRARERAEDREFRTAETKADREWQTSRDDRNFARERAARAEDLKYEGGLPGADYVDADGNLVSRSKDGRTVTPLKDDQGRPLPRQGGRSAITDNQMRLIRKDFDELSSYGDQESVAAAVEDVLVTYPSLPPETLRTWARSKLREGGTAEKEIEAALARMGLGGRIAPAADQPTARSAGQSTPRGDMLPSKNDGEPQPPPGLPDGAKWSSKLGTWVILRNGQWMRLDPAKGDRGG